jgi:hypothetical protein
MKAYVVCGSRLGYNFEKFYEIMIGLEKGSVIISGEASGVDEQAKLFALDLVNEMSYIGFPADWKKDGKAAGPIRNERMARKLREFSDKGYITEVIAFPGGNGTANMISIAKRFDLKVRLIENQ